MTMTIGFGITTLHSETLKDTLMAVTPKYGFQFSTGLDGVDIDVRAGLEEAYQHKGWQELVLLTKEDNSGFGIYEQLRDFEMKNELPVFFDFLRDFIRLAKPLCSEICVFFAGVWDRKQSVRYSYGTVETLISLLSLPGNWCLRFIDIQSDRLHDSDEIPLIFNIIEN